MIIGGHRDAQPRTRVCVCVRNAQLTRIGLPRDDTVWEQAEARVNEAAGSHEEAPKPRVDGCTLKRAADP